MEQKRKERKITDYDIADMILIRANIENLISDMQDQNTKRLISIELAKLKRLYQSIAHFNIENRTLVCDEPSVYDVLHVNEKGEVVGYEERVVDDDNDDDDEEEEELENGVFIIPGG